MRVFFLQNGNECQELKMVFVLWNVRLEKDK